MPGSARSAAATRAAPAVAKAARVIPLYVVVPPRLLMLDIAGPIDAIRRANLEQSAVRFDVIHVAPRPAVMTSIGLVVGKLAALPRSLPDDRPIQVPTHAGLLTVDLEFHLASAPLARSAESQVFAAPGK